MSQSLQSIVFKPKFIPFKALASGVAMTAILSLAAQRAAALPAGGTIAANNGEVTFDTTMANKTIVKQTSNLAIIDWTGFNVAANETVEFKVTLADGTTLDNTGATLNRISSAAPSQISGTVTSNAALYFSNPNGLVFAAGSVVNAPKFWAGTGAFKTDADNNYFMRDSYFRTNADIERGSKTVELNGTITAPIIWAAANSISVGGTLTAAGGEIKLISGTMTLVGSTAIISASASGATDNAGTIFLHSDAAMQVLSDSTTTHGLFAKGGSTSGNGGTITLSGARHFFNYAGRANTTAATGSVSGKLLFNINHDMVINGNGTENSVDNGDGTSTTTASTLTLSDTLPTLPSQSFAIKAGSLSDNLKVTDVTIDMKFVACRCAQLFIGTTVINGYSLWINSDLNWSGAATPHKLVIETGASTRANVEDDFGYTDGGDRVFLGGNITGTVGSSLIIDTNGANIVQQIADLRLKDLTFRTKQLQWINSFQNPYAQSYADFGRYWVYGKYLGVNADATNKTITSLGGVTFFFDSLDGNAVARAATKGTINLTATDRFYEIEYYTGALAAPRSGENFLTVNLVQNNVTTVAPDANRGIRIEAGNLDLRNLQTDQAVEVKANGLVTLGNNRFGSLVTITTTGNGVDIGGDIALSANGMTLNTDFIKLLNNSKITRKDSTAGDLRVTFGADGKFNSDGYKQLSMDGNIYLTGGAAAGHNAAIIMQTGTFYNQVVKNDASYSFAVADLPASSGLAGLNIHGQYYNAVINKGGTITVSGVTAGAFPILLRGTAITVNGANVFGGDLRLEATATGASGGVTIAGGSIAVAGRLMVKASGLSVTTDASVTGATNGVFIDLGTTGLATGAKKLTMTGQSLYFSGSTSGTNAVSFDLGSGVTQGKFYATKFLDGGGSLVAGDIPTTTSYNGLTFTTAPTREVAVVATGPLTVSGVTSTGTTALTLIADSIWFKGSTASSFMGALTLSAGNGIVFYQPVPAVPELASSLIIESAMTVNGNLTLLQRGNYNLPDPYGAALTNDNRINMAAILVKGNLTSTTGVIAINQSGISTYDIRGIYGIKIDGATLTTSASSGTIALTVASVNEIALAGTLTAGTAGAITVTGNGLRLIGPVSSANAAVTINLGQTGAMGNYLYSGIYRNSVGGNVAVAGNAWTTNNKGLTLSAGFDSLFNLGTGAVFKLGTGILTSPIQARSLNGRKLYVTDRFTVIDANDNATLRTELSTAGTADATAEYITIARYLAVGDAARGFLSNTGDVNWGYDRVYQDERNDVTFYKFTNLDLHQALVANSFKFTPASGGDILTFTHGLKLTAKTVVTINQELTVEGGEMSIIAGGAITIAKKLTVSGLIGRSYYKSGFSVNAVEPGDIVIPSKYVDSGLRLIAGGNLTLSEDVSVSNGDVYLGAVGGTMTGNSSKSIASNGGRVFLGAGGTITNIHINTQVGTSTTAGNFYVTKFLIGDQSYADTMVPGSNALPAGVTLDNGATATPTRLKAVVATGILSFNGVTSTATDDLWLEGSSFKISGTNSFAANVQFVASDEAINDGTVAAPKWVSGQVGGTLSTTAATKKLTFTTLVHLGNNDGVFVGIVQERGENSNSAYRLQYVARSGQVVVRGATITAQNIQFGLDDRANSIGSLLIDGTGAAANKNTFIGAVSVKTISWNYIGLFGRVVPLNEELPNPQNPSTVIFSPYNGGDVTIQGTNVFNQGLNITAGYGSTNYFVWHGCQSNGYGCQYSIYRYINGQGGRGGAVNFSGSNTISYAPGYSGTKLSVIQSGHGGYGHHIYGEGGDLNLDGTLTVDGEVQFKTGNRAENTYGGFTRLEDRADVGKNITLKDGFRFIGSGTGSKVLLQTGQGAYGGGHGSVSVLGAASFATTRLTIDLGSDAASVRGGTGGSGKIVGGGTITTNNGNLYLTTAMNDTDIHGGIDGNDAKINLGTGRFVFYRTLATPPATLDATTAGMPIGFDFSSVTPSLSADGLTYSLKGLAIKTAVGLVNVNNNGFVFNGAVTLTGITAASNTGKVTYIEATSIKLSGANSFNGGITLVSTGAGVTVSGNTAGIYVGASLSAAGDINLIQTGTGNSTGHGIFVAASANFTSSGNLTVWQNGEIGSAVGIAGIVFGGGNTVTAGGAGKEVRFKTAGKDLTLNGNIIVTNAGDRLTVDLGFAGKFQGGGSSNRITASNHAVFFSGNTTTNSHTGHIDIGASGNFVFITDRRDYFADVTLGDRTTNAAPNIGWEVPSGTWGNYGTGGFRYSTGFTVLTTNTELDRNQFGVRYGGRVILDGVGTHASGTAKNLSYIEGAGFKVTGNSGSTFDNNLTLVSSGAGVTSGFAYDEATPAKTAAFVIGQNLFTKVDNVKVRNLTLINRSVGLDRGIFIGAEINAAGNVSIQQESATNLEGILVKNATILATGNITLSQKGAYSNAAIRVELSSINADRAITLTTDGVAAVNSNSSSIQVAGSSLEAEGGDLVLTQKATGAATFEAIVLSSFVNPVTFVNTETSLKASGSVTLTQAGSAKYTGVFMAKTVIEAGRDINLLQTGTVTTDDVNVAGNGFEFALDLLNKSYNITAGGRVRIQTKNLAVKMTDGDSHMKIKAPNLSFGLGTGMILGGGTITAQGATVAFSGSLTGNNAKLVIGNGRLLVMTELAGDKDLTAATTAATDGWKTSGFVWEASREVDPDDGLTKFVVGSFTVKSGGAIDSVNGVGLRYDGKVTLSGITAASDVGKLDYLEGGSIVVKTASVFNNSLTMVSSGAGVTVGSNTAGIIIDGSLKVGTSGDGKTSLTLSHRGISSVNGIVIASTVTTGGNLTVQQTGFSLNEAILVTASGNLTSGRDILLDAQGTPASNAITLYSASFKAGGVKDSFVTIRTNNRNLNIDSTANLTVTNGRLRIDLGTGNVKGAGTITAQGLNLYYTGGITSSANAVTLDIGSGTFTYVSDKRSVTSELTIGATTTGSSDNGWGSGISFTAGTVADGVTPYTSTAGITVKTSGALGSVNGLGVVYGGKVILDGIGSNVAGTADQLRYIEGASVTVSGGSSSFKGSITLVSNGTETYGFWVTTGLSSQKTSDGKGDVTMIQTGGSASQVLGIAVNGVVNAAGNLRLFQHGVSHVGISIIAPTVVAGGDIELDQNGTAISETGIGLSPRAAQSFTAGSGGKNWVIFRTNNRNLDLSGNDLTIANSRLLISLGSGTFQGRAHTITASGQDVFFSGKTTDNSGTIAIGSGSFTFVTDRSNSFAPVTWTSATTATTADIGWTTDGLAFDDNTGIGGGLKVTKTGGTFATSDQKFGVIYGGALTITGLSADAQALNSIVADSIRFTTAAASFTNDISLSATTGAISNSVAITSGKGLTLTTNGGAITSSAALTATTGNIGLNSGGGIVTLSGGLTATAGSVDVQSGGAQINLGGNITTGSTGTTAINLASGGSDLVLTAAVTTTNGVVTINLKSADGNKNGVYDSNSTNNGFVLTTNGKNLNLTASAVRYKIIGTTVSNKIFALGVGNLVISNSPATMVATDPNAQAGTTYSVGSIIATAADETKFNSATSYYFTTSDNLAAAQRDVTIANSLVLDIATLSAANLGTKTVSYGGISGFSSLSGDITWTITSGNAPTVTTFTLATGKDIHFYKVNGSSFNNLTLANNSVTFDGINSFTAGLTLTSSGAITQAANATLAVSGGSLVIGSSSNSVTAITLNNTGNNLGTLGALYASGAVNINNTVSDLTVSANITTATTAKITITTGGKNLSLSNSITTASSEVELDLGVGTYNNGIGAGNSWTTGGKNLKITAGDVSNKDATTVFVLGAAGRFTVGTTGVKVGVANNNSSESYVYTGGYIDNTNYAAYSASDVVYYFTSDTGAALAANKTRVTNNKALWLNISALGATDLGTRKVIPINQVTTAGFKDNAGNIGWLKDNNNAAVPLSLANGKSVHLYNATGLTWGTGNQKITIDDLYLEGTVSFNGNTSITTGGAISQAAVAGVQTISVLNDGALSLSAGGKIELTSTSNSFVKLATVTAAGLISLTNSGALTVSGAISSSTSGAITISNRGGKLTLADVKTVGTITISNNSTISVKGDIWSQRTVVAGTSNLIKITTTGNSGDLEFADNVTSQGGTVTLDLGGYLKPSSGKSWNLSSNRLNLNASGWGSGDSDAVAFTNVSEFNPTGTWATTVETYSETTANNTVGWNQNGLDYFTTLTYGSDDYRAAEVSLKAIDPTAVLHPWSDLKLSGRRNYQAFLGFAGSTVSWRGTRSEDAYTEKYLNTRVGIYNSSFSGSEIAGLTSFKDNSTLTFAGVNRLRGGINFNDGILGRISNLNFAEDSSLKGGALTLSPVIAGNGIGVARGAILPQLDGGANNLILNISGGFDQRGSGAITGALRINAVGGSATVYLTNANNNISTLTGDTAGGSITVVTRGSISFNQGAGVLRTGGGSVVVTSLNGKISGTNIQTGVINFRAAGEVSLSGRFAGASGTGQSVTITNSSAGAVIGKITADGAVLITGTGSAILTDEIGSRGGGSVVIDAKSAVAEDVTLSSASGGVVEVRQEVRVLGVLGVQTQPLPKLTIDVARGQIVFSGRASLGTPDLSLGWIELNARQINNSIGAKLYYTDGVSIPVTGPTQDKKWLNGQFM
ncbi:MAG: hypothetical protein QM523_02940 [Candidatus Pacebacteria bacterium]|nr:hypothetical protein [Candidatus Paceibacterota bacterium]